jgi:uncharacterized membrane protein
MQKKEYQISFKLDEKLIQIIDRHREGTQRSRAAQVRYMIEKYMPSIPGMPSSLPFQTPSFFSFLFELLSPEQRFAITLLAIISIMIYFIPTYAAYRRGHPHRIPILIINLFTGFTYFGWVIALAWSFMDYRT